TRRARRDDTADLAQRGEAPARRRGSTTDSSPRPILSRRMVAKTEGCEVPCAPRLGGRFVRGYGGQRARLQKAEAPPRRRRKGESDANSESAISSTRSRAVGCRS